MSIDEKTKVAKIYLEMEAQGINGTLKIVLNGKIVNFSDTSLIESSSRTSRIFPSYRNITKCMPTYLAGK